MKFIVISNAPIISRNHDWYAYAPYVKEMDIWAKNVSQIAFCCPNWKQDNNLLITKIPFFIHKKIDLIDFNLTSIHSIFFSLLTMPFNILQIIRAMFWADHIHLRCPGNVGLLACFVQIFFPWKKKTVKYAGNWDLNSKQPWSYRLQKWILNNTFLSRNIQVLVYGEWENSVKNIKPFFTASYSRCKIDQDIFPRSMHNTSYRLLFVGTLSEGKQPLYAIKIIEKLKAKGIEVSLDIIGDGILMASLLAYCRENDLESVVSIHGNKSADEVEVFYKDSHFLLLPSKSEGWPKVVAEAMFWGCVPFATPVSCVPYMLKDGERGGILSLTLSEDVEQIERLINNPEKYYHLAKSAAEWSRKYTVEYFEEEIAKLLET